MRLDKKFILAPIAAAVMLIGAPAHAVPALQLDIAGGTYDTATQTIFASGNAFSLYAYGTPSTNMTSSQILADNFFLSMALVGTSSIPSTPANYGSFTVNSTTVNVTSGMIYCTPPIETVLGGAAKDPGDLASHGIFPTYFAEKKFNFVSGNQSGVYNTQDHAGWGPQSGTGMYYAKFDFNIAGLAAGYGIHFDFYNEILLKGGDIDVNKFAPFSHDAQGTVHVSPIPEPETYAMLLAGLGLMGFIARRRRIKQ